jgi:hypothetical protein
MLNDKLPLFEKIITIEFTKGIEVSRQIIPEKLYIKAKAKLERAGYTVKKLYQ